MKSKIFSYSFLLSFSLLLTNCRTNQQIEPKMIDEAELRRCPEFQDLVKTMKINSLQEYSDYQKKRWANIEKLSKNEQTVLSQKIKNENMIVRELRQKIAEKQRELSKEKPNNNASDIEIKNFNQRMSHEEARIYNESNLPKEYKDILIATSQKEEIKYQEIAFKTQKLVQTYPSLKTTNNLMFKRVLSEEVAQKNY